MAVFACACKNEAQEQKLQNDMESEVVVNADSTDLSLISAKVRKVVGDVKLQHQGSEKWNQIRIGNKVKELDRIRTAVESETVLGMKDGSALWITENSDVVIKAEILESLMKKVSVIIKKGKIYFDMQKVPKNETFMFETGLAIAAIRGTAGFVGSVGGKMVASLKEGKIEVVDNKGKTAMVLKNQTVVVDDKNGIALLNLKASGSEVLSGVLDSLIASMPEEQLTSELELLLKKFDDGYKKRQDEFEKKLKFLSSALPAEVFVPSVTLQARVNPGVIVTVLGESDTVPANGIYQKTFEWADDTYGTKRFLAICGNGDVEIPCYMWTTEYVVPLENAELSESEDELDENSLYVKIAGPRTEKVHNRAKLYTAHLKASLDGIPAEELNLVKSIVLKRGGKVVDSVPDSELKSLSYKFEQKIERNRIVHFEVDVILENNRVYKAKKTYEVFCNPRNHVGGKNVVNQKREYAQLKSKGMLKEE